jgi:hypothetical protein
VNERPVLILLDASAKVEPPRVAPLDSLEAMALPEHTNPDSTLPSELRGLTYDQATPGQIARTREHVRAQLAAADAYWTAEEREQRRATFLGRLNAA